MIMYAKAKLTWWCRTTSYLRNANKDIGHVVKRCMWYFPVMWVSRKRDCFFHLILMGYLYIEQLVSILVDCSDLVFWMSFCFSGMQTVSCTDWLLWFCDLNIFLLDCHAGCELLIDCSNFVFWMSFCLTALQDVSCTGWLLWFCVLNVFLLDCHAGCEFYWLIALILCSECLSACLSCS